MADPTQITPLARLIIDRIRQTGPMGLNEYMADCLLHPEHGYYTSKTPFGAQGDFITSPEISQMFGELLGLCLAQAWLDQGAAPSFTLAELGPGRGTLMADILRATRQVAGFHQAAQIHLIEASAQLRATQRAALADYLPTWADDVSTLPQAPLFLVANEFFDALPIKQFRREGDLWCETLVGADGDSLIFGKSAPKPALSARLTDTKQGDIVEVCPTAQGIMHQIASRITAFGGAALIIDYGGWNGVGDTFQAMSAHQYVAPLAAPGTADLTAHVDFAALAHAASGCSYTTQGAFLARLGIAQRAAQLDKSLPPDKLDLHLQATNRLTAATEMGELFKVLGIAPQAAPPLAGFDLGERC
jgi:NADH dehydrogenase [ubiquinone] 1 alpha subcomplex assembly factor 7